MAEDGPSGCERICAPSYALKWERRGRTSDDATLFMIEWHEGAADHLAVLD
ncbi:hypothetical protein ACWD62_39220 [Streptomyces sp. NPDC005146]|uniref:hypothetical protein n=1 Tax=Streptomyces sp. NPDC005096 TaxID=3154559 RepID=UPI0033A70238